MRYFCVPVIIAFSVAMPAFSSTLDIVSQIDTITYSAFLASLYTNNGDSRLWGAGHDLARDVVYNDLFGMGLTTSYSSFTYGGTTYKNVEATLPGVRRPNDVYIVSGHFDSYSGSDGAPGADDDASGVAGVLEAARILSQYDFQATLRFIAFDREEQGLIGSGAYAASHAGENILGAISLDMIAYNSAANHDEAWIIGQSAAFRSALINAVTTYSGGLTGVDKGTWEDCCSDQRSFENHGYPGALLIEHDPLSNPNYHKSTDSLDTPGYIDSVYATRMTRGTVGFLADSAGEETPEPGSAAILLLGVAGLAIVARKSRRSAPSRSV